MPLLFDRIMKFLSYPVGVVSDIEKAFHQVQISPSDRCMLRFLRFDDVRKDNPIIKRFQFGLTPIKEDTLSRTAQTKTNES